MKSAPARSASGFTITEMLALLILIGIALVLAMRLFVATTKLNYQTGQAHTETARIDSIVRALRGDVWGASEMTASNPASLTLSSSVGKIEWKTADDGALLRTETREGKSEARRWPAGASKFTFRVEGPIVTLIVPDSTAGRGGQVRLASQLQLAQRSVP